jgi:hypothetical protein
MEFTDFTDADRRSPAGAVEFSATLAAYPGEPPETDRDPAITLPGDIADDSVAAESLEDPEPPAADDDQASAPDTKNSEQEEVATEADPDEADAAVARPAYDQRDLEVGLGEFATATAAAPSTAAVTPSTMQAAPRAATPVQTPAPARMVVDPLEGSVDDNTPDGDETAVDLPNPEAAARTPEPRPDKSEEPEGQPDAVGGGSGGDDELPTMQEPEEPEEPHSDEQARVQLERAASREARSFVMPAEVRERPVKTGMVVDEHYTPDSDDMIGIKNLEGGGSEVTVSISDIGLLADLPATRRRIFEMGASTYYRADQIVNPMLHRRLSQGFFSLKEGQDTPVIARDFSFTEDGITTSDPYLAQARPTRLTYDIVDSIVGYDPQSPLVQLERLSNELDLQRQARGEIATWRPDLGYMLGPEGRLIPIPPDRLESPGQRIVRAFMIKYNEEMAAWMLANDVPAIYRDQHIRGGLSIQEVQETLRDGTLNEQRQILLQLRAGVGPAELTTTPAGHDIFGVPAYLRQSSPLRRAEDFVNAANAWAKLTGQPYPFPAEVLPTVIADIRQGEAVRRLEQRRRGPRQRVARVATRTAVTLSRESSRGTVRGLGIVPELPSEYVQDIETQIAEERLSPRDLADLIFATPAYASPEDQEPGWAALTDKLMDYMQDHPNETLNALNYLGQLAGASYSLTRDSENPPYTFTGRYSLGSDVDISVTMHNVPSKLVGRQQAALRLMSVMAGRLETGGSHTLPDVAPEVTPAEIDKLADPVSQLFDYVQKSQGGAHLRFGSTEIQENGPVRVVLYDQFGIPLGTGEGQSRSEARRNIARTVLREMGQTPRSPEEHPPGTP